MKLKPRLEKSNSQTKHCYKCFKIFSQDSLVNLINPNQFLCKNCLNERKNNFSSFKISNCKAYTIFNYDDYFKNTLYTLKGCGDIEIAKTILNPYEFEISLFFHGYFLVPAPSCIDDDLARGFNHVEEIFKSLKLPFLKIISKKHRIKQSDRSKDERKQIINDLEVKSNIDLKGKKILIVDDVITTGNTIMAMINLLKPLNPKVIKVLAVARTEFNKKHK